MKIQIISIPRSGSSYLIKLISKKLELSANTYSISEIFNPLKNYNFENVLENIKNYNSVITKNHVNHLSAIQKTMPDKFFQFKNVNWFTIVLLRKDIFENTISRCISYITGEWNNYSYTDNNCFYIDVDYFISNLNETINYWHIVDQNTLEIEYNKIVYYEDLTFNANIDFKHLDIFLEDQDITLFSTRAPSKYKLVKNIFELKEISDSITANLNFQNIKPSIPC